MDNCFCWNQWAGMSGFPSKDTLPVISQRLSWDKRHLQKGREIQLNNNGWNMSLLGWQLRLARISILGRFLSLNRPKFGAYKRLYSSMARHRNSSFTYFQRKNYFHLHDSNSSVWISNRDCAINDRVFAECLCSAAPCDCVPDSGVQQRDRGTVVYIYFVWY